MSTIDHLNFCKLSFKDYLQQMRSESRPHAALSEISYRYQTEQKVQSVTESQFTQWLACKFIMPATSYSPSALTTLRTKQLDFNVDDILRLSRISFELLGRCPRDVIWKYKRASIDVDGMLIDAMLIARESTAANGKWVLYSNGNATPYEHHKAGMGDVKPLSFFLDANVLVFNYPKVGSSSGPLTRETLAKTYKAMLRFLEDKETGIGAETIIGYGRSMGGAVQAEGLDSHALDPDINYVFVKDRTFSTLSKAASGMMNSWGGRLVEFLGWNMDTASCSKKLSAYEIILQTTDANGVCVSDKVISKEACLADALFAEPLNNKTFIALPGVFHNDSYDGKVLAELTKSIEASVKTQVWERAAEAAREQAI